MEYCRNVCSRQSGGSPGELILIIIVKIVLQRKVQCYKIDMEWGCSCLCARREF